MREIKFRGKVKSDGLWEYGSLWIDKGKYYINGTDNNWWEVIPETVGQFTGLKDKNNVEIYEGDIVIVRKISLDDKIYIATVDFQTFGRYGFAYAIDYKNDNGKIYYGLNEQKYIEVIGNIHENKELLEVKE